MKTEALRLALEALEDNQHLVADNERHVYVMEYNSIIEKCKDALAQPEQEPVAWMDDYNACKCPDNEARCFSDKVFRMMQKHTNSLVKRQEPVAKVCHDLDGHIGWNPNLKQLPNEGTPLYTTPSQRKPLTDEEIILIVAECAASHQHTDIHFARAIERAHGIKGEAV